MYFLFLSCKIPTWTVHLAYFCLFRCFHMYSGEPHSTGDPSIQLDIIFTTHVHTFLKRCAFV